MALQERSINSPPPHHSTPRKNVVQSKKSTLSLKDIEDEQEDILFSTRTGDHNSSLFNWPPSLEVDPTNPQRLHLVSNPFNFTKLYSRLHSHCPIPAKTTIDESETDSITDKTVFSAHSPTACITESSTVATKKMQSTAAETMIDVCKTSIIAATDTVVTQNKNPVKMPLKKALFDITPIEKVWSCDLCGIDKMTSREFWQHCLGDIHLALVNDHKPPKNLSDSAGVDLSMEALMEGNVAVAVSHYQTGAAVDTIDSTCQKQTSRDIKIDYKEDYQGDEWSILVSTIQDPDMGYSTKVINRDAPSEEEYVLASGSHNDDSKDIDLEQQSPVFRHKIHSMRKDSIAAKVQEFNATCIYDMSPIDHRIRTLHTCNESRASTPDRYVGVNDILDSTPDGFGNHAESPWQQTGFLIFDQMVDQPASTVAHQMSKPNRFEQEFVFKQDSSPLKVIDESKSDCHTEFSLADSFEEGIADALNETFGLLGLLEENNKTAQLNTKSSNFDEKGNAKQVYEQNSLIEVTRISSRHELINTYAQPSPKKGDMTFTTSKVSRQDQELMKLLPFVEKNPHDELWSCIVCNLQRLQNHSVKEHCAGRRHTLALKMIMNSSPIASEIKKVSFNDPVQDYSDFYNHTILKSVQTDDRFMSIRLKKESRSFACDLCNVELQKKDVQPHCRGKKHTEAFKNTKKYSC